MIRRASSATYKLSIILVMMLMTGCSTSDADSDSDAAAATDHALTGRVQSIISLDGYSWEPEIRLFNDPSTAGESLPDEIVEQLNFDESSVIWLRWYRPNPCVDYLISDLTENNEQTLEIQVLTDSSDKEFCTQIVMPYEKVILVAPHDGPVSWQLDGQLIARWTAEEPHD
ncbi:MAG: hypothetical protein HJJLKODD_00373 [Phycisphaerae bacterium]|nr:hypothetical protein [Phycisphaerae bacterium]